MTAHLKNKDMFGVHPNTNSRRRRREKPLASCTACFCTARSWSTSFFFATTWGWGSIRAVLMTSDVGGAGSRTDSDRWLWLGEEGFWCWL